MGNAPAPGGLSLSSTVCEQGTGGVWGGGALGADFKAGQGVRPPWQALFSHSHKCMVWGWVSQDVRVGRAGVPSREVQLAAYGDHTTLLPDWPLADSGTLRAGSQWQLGSGLVAEELQGERTEEGWDAVLAQQVQLNELWH